MGAEAWCCLVDYDVEPERALRSAQAREFAAGRYAPVMRPVPWGLDPELPRSLPAHASIAAAREAADADGTASVLDVIALSERSEPGHASPFSADEIEDALGSTRPTRQDLGDGSALLDLLGRGEASYLCIYSGDEPAQLLFMGWSCD